jgi:16S rRNA C1402 N4-methylase RsmH
MLTENADEPNSVAIARAIISQRKKGIEISFQRFFREGVYREKAPGPVRPSSEECNTNGRARSAKLRWAIKV